MFRKFSTNVISSEELSKFTIKAAGPVIGASIGVASYIIGTSIHTNTTSQIHNNQIKNIEQSLDVIRDDIKEIRADNRELRLDIKEGFKKVNEDIKEISNNFNKVNEDIKEIFNNLKNSKKDLVN